MTWVEIMCHEHVCSFTDLADFPQVPTGLTIVSRLRMIPTLSFFLSQAGSHTIHLTSKRGFEAFAPLDSRTNS